MKIVVFGATGRTGRKVVEEALTRGHDVRAVRRSPPDSLVVVPGREWVTGDVCDPDSTSRAIVGADAVISTVGVGTSRGETRVYSSGVQNMLQAMDRTGTKRLAVVSAAPVGHSRAAPLGHRLSRPALWAFFGASYRDMTRMESILADHTEVIWACLRPPFLRDRPTTRHYAVQRSTPFPGVPSMTTGDLACALLDFVDQPLVRSTTAYVATKPGVETS